MNEHEVNKARHNIADAAILLAEVDTYIQRGNESEAKRLLKLAQVAAESAGRAMKRAMPNEATS